MAEQVASRFPKRSVRYVTICALGIALFSGLAIYPSYRSLSRLEEQIQALTSSIRKQEVLYPTYKELFAKSQEKRPRLLPFPAKEKLARDKTGEIQRLLGDLAGRSGVKLIHAIPDVKSLAGKSGLLAVTCRLEGDFMDFRRFLIILGELPYLGTYRGDPDPARGQDQGV